MFIIRVIILFCIIYGFLMIFKTGKDNSYKIGAAKFAAVVAILNELIRLFGEV